jgi:hypothetical protein
MKIPASFLLVLFFLPACNNDEFFLREKFYGTWEATTFISVESANYAKKDGYNPTITFKVDGSYGLRLDANGCGGSFSLTDHNQLSIDPAFCTEICCDSDFSKKFAGMLSKVSTFSFERYEKLLLHVDGWGSIKLVRVD